MRQFASGEAVGNGAAIPVELGWIPDFVIVSNVTDSDKVTYGWPNRMAIPFSSGGTNEIAAGDTIVGATSRARARVLAVLLYSGSFAAGDAAGFIIIERDGLTGTFGSENVTHGVDFDTEVAAATGNAGIAAYEGVAASASKGFTIGSTVAEEAKLLRWSAFRAG